MVDIPADFIGIGVEPNFAEMLTYLFSTYGLVGVTEEVLSGSAVTVANNVSVLFLNFSAPHVSTTINLGSVVNRTVSQLQIVDLTGNGGDITVVPHGAETIMGLGSALMISNGQGYGLAAAETFWPSTAINGWYTA